MPKEVLQGLKITTVANVREALRIALTDPLPRARRSVKRDMTTPQVGFFEYMKDASLPH